MQGETKQNQTADILDSAGTLTVAINRNTTEQKNSQVSQVREALDWILCVCVRVCARLFLVHRLHQVLVNVCDMRNVSYFCGSNERKTLHFFRNKDSTWKLSFENKTVDVLLLPPSGHLRVKHYDCRNLVYFAGRCRKAFFQTFLL